MKWLGNVIVLYGKKIKITHHLLHLLFGFFAKKSYGIKLSYHAKGQKLKPRRQEKPLRLCSLASLRENKMS